MEKRLSQSSFLCSIVILPFLFHFTFAYHNHPQNGQNQQLFLFDEQFNLDNPSKHGGEESETEYFDLSYTYDDNTLFFPGQRFDFELYKDVGPGINRTKDGNYKYSYASYSFCMSEHGGTHMDAPFHFNRYGWRLNEIPLKRLVDVPAVVVDVEHQVFSLRNPDTFLLELKHIEEHESQFGKIPKGAVVLIRFGWAEKFWNDHLRYSGWDNTTVRAGQMPRLNFPGVANNVAKWLVDERSIVGIGTDTLSPELGAALQNNDPVVHIILLESQVYIIENVANLDYLIRKTRKSANYPSGCNLRMFVMPIKTQGTGGPTRLVAYCRN